MPARSPVCSRCAERQRGAAVVLALLTVTFAAMLAAAALADFGRGLEAVTGRRDQAQSRQLARAAVDWARQVLALDMLESNVDHGGENWTIRIPPTQLGEDAADGTIAGEIIDLSGRFNLNDLAPAGLRSSAAGARLQRLMELLGTSPESARASVIAMTEWIATAPRGDTDHAPHSALVVADEVASIPGIDHALLARLRPYVTAVPAPAPVNVNTAAAEVLSSLVPGLGIDSARVLVAERERAWFRDLADFNARLPQGTTPPAAQLASVSSRHFLVTIHASYGISVTRLEALLDRQKPWPELLWYRIP
ncbi:general secretion pathway protein GspK [Parazoarcus communis]|uniref:Type II secretion system protein K n=1 Tax=Parazoarcus communis TaxID=41977 RepID=A0A2U8GM57_9RHOO|nr:type II secretion system minor pseudopilin GspK [Parazoarcus communis]AWI74046.1 general secretion pathway protein GspK [Parazoarcus communis]